VRPESEIAAGGFHAESGNRLRFSVSGPGAGELVAVTAAPARQIVSLGPGRACLLLADGSLAAYAPTRARPLWNTHARSFERIATTAGVVLAQEQERVAAFDAEDGRELWSASSARLCDPTAEPAAVTLVIGGRDVALADARTGARRWTLPVYQNVRECRADGDLVVFLDARDALGAIDAATGRVRWQREVGLSTGTAQESANLVGLAAGSPLVTRRGPEIAAFDRLSGRELWRFQWAAPSSSEGRFGTLLAAPTPTETWIAAAWPGRDETRYVQLHEVLRVDAGGSITFRVQGPAGVDGALRALRVVPEGLVVTRGSWDEVWEMTRVSP